MDRDYADPPSIDCSSVFDQEIYGLKRLSFIEKKLHSLMGIFDRKFKNPYFMRDSDIENMQGITLTGVIPC